MAATAAEQAQKRDDFVRDIRKQLIEYGLEGMYTIRMSPRYAAKVAEETGASLDELAATGMVCFVIDADVDFEVGE